MIQLGDRVRDEVSGFEGVVLAKLESLHEAPSCRVHPSELSRDGKIIDSVWFEDTRLKVLEHPSKPIKGFMPKDRVRA